VKLRWRVPWAKRSVSARVRDEVHWAYTVSLVLCAVGLFLPMTGVLALRLPAITEGDESQATSLGQEIREVWEPPINLSDTPDFVSRYPDITVDRTGRVHVVWVEHLSLEEIPADNLELGTNYLESESIIVYATWYRGKWSDAVDIVYELQSIILPTIAVDDHGLAHLVYWVGGHLLYASSVAGGELASAQAWSRPLDLSDELVTENNRWPDLTVDAAGTLHLTYTSRNASLSGREGEIELRYTHTPDKGRTWAWPALLSRHSASLQFESHSYTGNLAVDSQGQLHMVFPQEGIPVYARSDDGGDTWSTGMPVSTDPAQMHNSGYVHVLGQQVHLLWGDGHGALYHRWSADGRTFRSPASQLTPGGSTIYGGIAVVSDSLGRLVVAYPYKEGVWARIWDRDSWSEATNVSGDSGRTNFWPRMAISGGNTVHLVWYAGFPELGLFDAEERLGRGEYEIFYARLRLDAPSVPVAHYEPKATPEPGPAWELTQGAKPLPSPTTTRTVSPFGLDLEPADMPRAPQLPILVGAISAATVALVAVIVATWRRWRVGR
jgi:hypothetical protein